MILPLGGPICDQRLVVIDKTEGKISQRDLLPVRFVPLVPRKVQIVNQCYSGNSANFGTILNMF